MKPDDDLEICTNTGPLLRSLWLSDEEFIARLSKDSGPLPTTVTFRPVFRSGPARARAWLAADCSVQRWRWLIAMVITTSAAIELVLDLVVRWAK